LKYLVSVQYELETDGGNVGRVLNNLKDSLFSYDAETTLRSCSIYEMGAPLCPVMEPELVGEEPNL
jgi:hypothetical protein